MIVSGAAVAVNNITGKVFIFKHEMVFVGILKRGWEEILNRVRHLFIPCIRYAMPWHVLYKVICSGLGDF